MFKDSLVVFSKDLKNSSKEIAKSFFDKIEENKFSFLNERKLSERPTIKEAISDLKELFQTADLVKFAKHDPQMNENDANLINAIDFINETKQPEEENQKPQPTEITIIEKRSLRTKVLLICGIAILSTALIGTFIYIGMQLYNLFA